ncbi:MAG: aminoacyl-tRNA hydrolase [Alphaproteobacteria bacterium]|nr:aminoacyl-tRNA hydrolase [Alphaproteobacteria bacterium]
MWILVGLGNPGSKYENNRHNVGFMVVDAIQKDWPKFDPYRSKFQGSISEGRIHDQKVLLLKPETYMNHSGQSVVAAASFYKIPVERIIVFHDELDLPFNEVRVKQGGGNAGHNGLKSMQAHLGSADFWRVRIGIGRPEHKEDVSNFVLNDYAKAERDVVDHLISVLASKIDVVLKDNPKVYEDIIK